MLTMEGYRADGERVCHRPDGHEAGPAGQVFLGRIICHGCPSVLHGAGHARHHHRSGGTLKTENAGKAEVLFFPCTNINEGDTAL